MEADLASLGSGVEAVAKKVREFEKNLKPAKKPEAEAEHELVKMICASVRIISKTRGDKLFEPPSLKRFTKIFGLHAMLEKALKEKHAAEKGKIYPDLCWLLANLAHLGKWEGLANRLAQQVEMVRDVARLLNVEAKGKAVKTKLSKYLAALKVRISRPGEDQAWIAFWEDYIAVTERFWDGLFACYDVKGLPRNNNELETFFRTLKWHQRRVQGKKSTAGGPLESFAPLLVQLWPQLKNRPELENLIQDLRPDEVKRARDGLKFLEEPATKRRSFNRDSDARIQSALAKWSDPTGK